MRTEKAIGIALAVGAVGAGTALLFAPQSGARTRRMFRRKAEDIGQGFREAYHEVIEKGKGNGVSKVAYKLRMRLAPKRSAERWSHA
jgi:gas vesicle protein